MSPERTPTNPNEVKILPSSQFIDSLSFRLKNVLNPVGEDYLNSRRKRALDILGSVIIAPFAIGPVIVSAAFIKLEDQGPIFYIAKVVDKQNEEFGMIKLRTMKPTQSSIEEETGLVIFTKDLEDYRITKAGRFIRQWSIDELPQLVNILSGEMSLVGNRPMFRKRMENLASVEKLRDLYPKWIKAYSLAKSGAAGLATARGRALLDQSEQGLRRRLRYETFYIKHASLCFDVQILFETLISAITRRGAS